MRRLQEASSVGVRYQPRWQGMTATLVAAEIREDSAVIYHVGDSPAWLIRGSTAQRLTRDHTILERLIDEGELTREEAGGLATIYDGLDRYFAAFPDEEPPQHDEYIVALVPGDILILATDGLSTLSPEMIASAVSDDLEAMGKDLFQKAVAEGSDDNISVILLRSNAV